MPERSPLVDAKKKLFIRKAGDSGAGKGWQAAAPLLTSLLLDEPLQWWKLAAGGPVRCSPAPIQAAPRLKARA